MRDKHPREFDRIMFPETLEEKVGAFLMGVAAVCFIAGLIWLLFGE